MTPVVVFDPYSGHSSAAEMWIPEPIAIIGMGCRFPGGASTPAAFWQLLCSGADAIREVPEERWNIDRFYSPDVGTPGKMYVRKGGFLQEALDRFDAAFFGISPREAVYMDPQQRLLLEVAWEAMEDAGIAPPDLAGSETGVYVGGFTLDNLLVQMSPLNRGNLGTHSATSSSMTMLANRLSYCFDFHGPSVSVDTACSASLVAVHLACQALSNGECSLALAGGANIMLRPEYPIVMCQGHFLAPDGYCKSFDERANGYSRGEGVGIVVLKRLAAALRDSDDIYALIRGTGLNQDGRTDGITVPNPESQEALIRHVYARANIPLNKVRYIEAHGTGTSVGDPIEATVLGRTVGAGRKGQDACIVGSVKATIGHLEAAAGIAGLIKAALCLRNETIPPQANLHKPNPAIPFEELGIRLPHALEAMPNGDESIYVGVNSFGYGGTNAHVVLQAMQPEVRQEPEHSSRPQMLTLSARDKNALTALARAYVSFLSDPGAPALRDVCYSASVRRAHHDHRLAAIAQSVNGMVAELCNLIEHGHSEHVCTGKMSARAQRKPVFVLTGMGPQWWGMGRELLESEPVFRRAADGVDEVFRSVAGWSILTEMLAGQISSRMNETQVAQPANFLLQVALVEFLQSWGVSPAAIVGHSVGEVSAAYVSGVLGIEDAVRVSYHRSRLQQRAAGKGRMLATGLRAQQAEMFLADHEGLVSIAAINSPAAVTLSGDSDALAAIAAKLDRKGIFSRFLQVEVAYHSPQIDVLEPEMREVLHDLRPRQPAVPLYSTVTGGLVKGLVYDAEYWCENIRKPVLFAEAINNILVEGHSAFLEVGPHPVLATSIKEALRQNGTEGVTFASLRREEPERQTILMGLGGLYTRGYDVDWRALTGEGARYVKLPHYPWQRESYWSESQASITDRIGRSSHPLLGMKMPTPEPAWEGELNHFSLAYLDDHVIESVAVFPAAAYIEQGFAIQSLIERTEAGVLEDIEFRRALVFSTGKDTVMRSTFDESSREYRIYSRHEDKHSAWTLHASGRISPAPPFTANPVAIEEIKRRCETIIEAESFYERLAAHGLQYGPSFRRIQRLWRRTGEVLAELDASDLNGADITYHLHPTLVDAAVQSLVAGLDSDGANSRVYLPVSIRRVSYHSRVNGHCWSFGRLRLLSEDAIEGDLILCNAQGSVIAEVLGLRCQALASFNADPANRLKQCSYVMAWEKAEREGQWTGASSWLVFADQAGLGRELAIRLRALGAAEVVDIAPQDVYEIPRDAPARMSGKSRERLDRILTEAGTCQGIAYLWGLDMAESDGDPTERFAHIAFLHLVQALSACTGAQTPHRLYVVTNGAQRVSGEQVPALAQAPIVGLARTALSEYPDLRCTLVDLDLADGLQAVSELADELLSNSAEKDVALRGTSRYVHRLMPLSQTESGGETSEEATLTAAQAGAFRLEMGTRGRIESLRFRQLRRQPPGPGEVEIHIHAAALNFKDVLKALAMLPERALESTYHGTGLGMEAAGVISAVGKGVHEYQVGDEIVASVRDSFSSHVTVPANRMFGLRKLNGMSFADAASLPVIFMTAYYALHELAHLRRGETVLIHAAAGGVGLAAVQVARWLGARIIATAGTEEKRDYIRSLGVDHVLSSRTLEFADQVMVLTGGRGVDVLLNSLSGETFFKSLAIVAPLGRFIEIGKRDIVDNARLPLLFFNRNLSFSAIDLDRIMTEQPELIRHLLNEVWERFRAGDFRPTPVSTFPATKIVDAFRHMAQSKQIGKIVIKLDDLDGISVVPLKETRVLLKSDASYLITGGFGGFGLQVARWMAQEGAHYLVLVGRTGAKTAEAHQAVRELQSQGVIVKAIAADIGQENDVVSLLADLRHSMPPVRGVMHAAAALDDALLVNLDKAQLLRVMAPKARGAWLLHKYTQGLPLDFFVLFSSISALVGNPGQGNYVAANVFLDTLAHHRRALGLPATSVNWGALAEVGMAARNKDLVEHLARVGIKTIAPADAMAALSSVLQRDATQLGFMDVDWAKWLQFHPAAAASPNFIYVLGNHTAAQACAADHVRIALLSVKPKHRPDMLALIVAELIADTMRMPSNKIDINHPLSEMGIDSLMAVELQIGINMKFGIEFPVLDLMRGESIIDLAHELLTLMKIPLKDSAQEANSQHSSSRPI